MKALTVAELIAKLQTMPPDLLVDVEGCDCYRRAAVDVSTFSDYKGASVVLVESADWCDDSEVTGG